MPKNSVTNYSNDASNQPLRLHPFITSKLRGGGGQRILTGGVQKVEKSSNVINGCSLKSARI